MITKEQVETAIAVLRAYTAGEELPVTSALLYELEEAIEQASEA